MDVSVLFEDEDILVCYKPAGVPTQTKSVAVQDMVSILKNYLKANGQAPYVGVVHRLDQPVEGIMVFARNSEAAAYLSGQAAGNGMEKYYQAVVTGLLSEKSGRLEHQLLKDGKNNRSKVVPAGTKGAKHAVLTYEVTEEQEDSSLVTIHLETGRHHQIRVQFAACGHPLAGDMKYGNEEKRTGQSSLALCSVKLCFRHPRTKQKKEFSIVPSGIHFQKFDSCKGILQI